MDKLIDEQNKWTNKLETNVKNIEMQMETNLWDYCKMDKVDNNVYEMYKGSKLNSKELNNSALQQLETKKIKKESALK